LPIALPIALPMEPRPFGSGRALHSELHERRVELKPQSLLQALRFFPSISTLALGAHADSMGWILPDHPDKADPAPPPSQSSSFEASSSLGRPATPDLASDPLITGRTLGPSKIRWCCFEACRETSNSVDLDSRMMPRLCPGCRKRVASPLCRLPGSLLGALTRLERLQALELDASDLSDEAATPLLARGVFPGLHTLKLFRCQHLTDAGLHRVAASDFAPLLRTLALTGCRATVLGPGLEAIVTQARGLTSLDLSGCSFPEECLASVVRLLKWPLRKLGLAKCRGLGPGHLRVVVCGLPMLTRLDLSFCSPELTSSLGQSALSSLINLTTLTLRGLPSLDSALAAALVSRAAPTLTQLDLSQSLLDDAPALACVGAGLEGSLRVLVLDACPRVTDALLEGVAGLLLADEPSPAQSPPIGHGSRPQASCNLALLSLVSCPGLSERALTGLQHLCLALGSHTKVRF